MMNRMIVGNLVHRPVRSLISIVAVALEVTLILLIVGLCMGMLQDQQARTAGIGADVIVLPPGSSFIAGLTGSPMSIKVAGILAKLPHVEKVAPVITTVSTAGTLEIITGIDLQSYESLSGGFHYLKGGQFQDPDDVIVDDLFAQAKHVNVGDTIEILSHPFRICGIVAHGKGGRKFLPLSTMQDLTGAEGKASQMYLKLDDPANAGDRFARAELVENVVDKGQIFFDQVAHRNFDAASEIDQFAIESIARSAPLIFHDEGASIETKALIRFMQLV